MCPWLVPIRRPFLALGGAFIKGLTHLRGFYENHVRMVSPSGAILKMSLKDFIFHTDRKKSSATISSLRPEVPHRTFTYGEIVLPQGFFSCSSEKSESIVALHRTLIR